MYRPVTFTSKYDCTIGAFVDDFDPPSRGDYDHALSFGNGYVDYDFTHVRFRYAYSALVNAGDGTNNDVTVTQGSS